jgi:dihydroxy-acid dehydratase
MAYETGRRIVDMVAEELTPRKVMTRPAFLNAIRTASAIGASTNCPPHLIAIARHAGVDLTLEDWQTYGHEIPLLVDCQPAGRFLGEAFHRAGAVPAVMAELLRAGKLDGAAITVTGKPVGDILASIPAGDPEVIRPYGDPLKEAAGFVVLSGNLFESALMKTSVIDPDFRARYLSNPNDPEAFEARAIVFDGPEDYHARLNDPALAIDENCILVIRGCGPIGYPGSAEVVNMQPPDALIQRGIMALPTLGDGRQSGTSGSPSILNVSPEAAAGGGLAWLKTGDRIRVDLRTRTVDVLLPADDWAARKANEPAQPAIPASQTPWQEMYRKSVGQLQTGGCLDFATAYHQVAARSTLRHSH